MTSPLAVLESGSLTAYWRFHRAVAAAQLQAWLPAGSQILLDISGPQAGAAAQAAASGHAVVRVLPQLAGVPEPPPPARMWRGRARHLVTRPSRVPGQLVSVVADPASLGFLADASVDGVIADNEALSRHLMAEDVAAEISRVLRPGGQLLACVDSLVLGMSILAEQRHWAELTDLPQAEVVLVPWPDGRITRCFSPEQLTDLLGEAGLEVSWIRPRTVLSPSMVDHVLHRDPGAIARLVRAELAAGNQDDSPWPGRPGPGTPGPGTPGPATPGHSTPGHSTPGRSAPGHSTAGNGAAPAALSGTGGSESFGIFLIAAARKPGP